MTDLKWHVPYEAIPEVGTIIIMKLFETDKLATGRVRKTSKDKSLIVWCREVSEEPLRVNSCFEWAYIDKE